MIKEYKSNTFSLLIQEPKYALQVFNALNGTNYEDESNIHQTMICTERILYIFQMCNLWYYIMVKRSSPRENYLNFQMHILVKKSKVIWS